MSGLLEGQVALVTGAGGWVGEGIARRFSEEGARVALHCRKEGPGVRELAEELGGAVVLEADLREEEQCHRLVREAAEWGGGLTALVNCAGVQPVRPLEGMGVAEWREVMEANVTSVFACTQAAAEVMRGAGGSITHVASVEGHVPTAGHAHYSASKAAVLMHARSAAQEYGAWGVRVNSVSPGLIDREGLEEAWPEGVERWKRATALGRLGRRGEVGDACVFLASGLASWVTGQDLVVDGGVLARGTW